MQLEGQSALVTGGGSGLGAATAVALARAGARVAVLDVDAAKAAAVAEEIGGLALAADIADGAGVDAALDAAEAAHGAPRIVMNIAGIGAARRVLARDGTPTPLTDFESLVRVNLVGTYNVLRLASARIARLAPLADDERGLILMTASVAAFEGQVGQHAYAASKGGIAAMTLPLARDLAQFGIRVVTIAPGLFRTPLTDALPDAVQASLASTIPFPRRLGHAQEFAALALHAVVNTHLNGEVIRLDGALRMAAR